MNNTDKYFNMKIFAFLALSVFAQVDDDGSFRGEKGPKSCNGVKLMNGNGVIWQCSSRAERDSKKCRGEF